MNETALPPTPEWTNEWACGHYTNWMKHLGKFKGQPARALEIGSCEGRSSCFFVQNILTHPDSRLACVDPWVMPGTEPRFQSNIDILGCRDKMEIHKTFSDGFPLMGPPEYDFIYIDGFHSAAAVMKDACRSWVALKKGGIMIFDDLMWHINDFARVDAPKLAIDSFLLIFEKELKVMHIGQQVIVEKKV